MPHTLHLKRGGAGEPEAGGRAGGTMAGVQQEVEEVEVEHAGCS